jgi:hypothetical protein
MSAPHRVRRSFSEEVGVPTRQAIPYSQYTTTKRKSQTTSTKCQYHATA